MRIHQATDVVVLGGGVKRCSIAYHLSKVSVRISVIEREEIALEVLSAAVSLLTQRMC